MTSQFPRSSPWREAKILCKNIEGSHYIFLIFVNSWQNFSSKQNPSGLIQGWVYLFTKLVRKNKDTYVLKIVNKNQWPIIPRGKNFIHLFWMRDEKNQRTKDYSIYQPAKLNKIIQRSKKENMWRSQLHEAQARRRVKMISPQKIASHLQ